jgi:hypothetical protein
MKIALMLHGQARHFLHTYELNKKNIIDKYDVDVFCHLTWDEEIKKNGYVGRRNVYSVDENTPDKIIELYKPKKIVITEEFRLGENEQKILNDFNRFKNVVNCQNSFFTLLQFKGISEASKLFEWSEYDFIIKMRYDCGFIALPNLHELNKNKMYVGRDDWGTCDDRPDCFIDLTYIVPNTFQNFVNVYDNLKIDEEFINIYGTEPVYTYYLHKFGLVDKLVKMDRTQYILSCPH